MATTSKGASAFRRRAVDLAQVEVAEKTAANSALVGSVKSAAPHAPSPVALTPVVTLPSASESNLDSIQDSTGLAQMFIAGQAKIGGIYEVPLPLITSNPMPPRFIYTVEMVEDMIVTLRDKGQLHAATGFLNDSGGVTLIEGETRFRASRALGKPTLRIEIRPVPESMKGLYEKARAANADRKQQTPLDDAMAWRRMLDDKTYPSQVAIARAFNLREDDVSRTVSLASLPESIMHTLVKHPDLLNLKMLDAIRQFHDAKGQDETISLIDDVIRSGLGYREVHARRTAGVKPPPVKRPRSSRETVTFGEAKGELKIFEEDGRLEMSVKNLSAEEADDLKIKLRAIFQKNVKAD